MKLDCETVREHLLVEASHTFDAVAPHLETCPDCRRLADRVRLTEGLLREHEPAKRPSWTAPVLGLAAAATVLLVGIPVVRSFLYPPDTGTGVSPGPPTETEEELREAHPECWDLVRLEPSAIMGRLKDAEIACLESRVDLDASEPARAHAMSILVVDARSRRATDPDAFGERAAEYAQRIDRPTEWLALLDGLDLRADEAWAHPIAARLLASGFETEGLRAYADGAPASDALLDWAAHLVTPRFSFPRQAPPVVRDPHQGPVYVAKVRVEGPTGLEIEVRGERFVTPLELNVLVGRHTFASVETGREIAFTIDESTDRIDVSALARTEQASPENEDRSAPTVEAGPGVPKATFGDLEPLSPPGSPDPDAPHRVMVFHDEVGIPVTIDGETLSTPAFFDLAPGTYEVVFGEGAVPARRTTIEVTAGSNTQIIQLHKLSSEPVE